MPLASPIFDLYSEHFLLFGGLLLFITILVMKAGNKIGVPALLLFLVMGLLAGVDRGVAEDKFEMAQFLGELCMTVILLTDGLELSLHRLGRLRGRGILLFTAGTLLMALLTGLFVYLFLGDRLGAMTGSFLGCMLLAAVLSSTDAAYVESVLKARGLELKEPAGPMVAFESGGNEPVAYLLTITVSVLMSRIGAGHSVGKITLDTCVALFAQPVVGMLVGLVMGVLSRWLLPRLGPIGQAPLGVFVLCMGVLTNALAANLYGNGLLALFVFALFMGNRMDLPYRKEIIQLLSSLRWLAQMLMFLLLGIVAHPPALPSVAGPAVAIVLFILLVARPVGVFACLAGRKDISFRQKLFQCWAGVKGASPMLFIMTPVIVGVEGAVVLFNVVFVTTLFSMALQGLTLVPVAKLLKVAGPLEEEPYAMGVEVPEDIGELSEHILRAEDLEGGDTVRELPLDDKTRVLMVQRGTEYISPHGSLKLLPGDKVLLIDIKGLYS